MSTCVTRDRARERIRNFGAAGLFATTRGRLAIADPQFTNSPLRPGDAVA
jgi:hypothetical protein